MQGLGWGDSFHTWCSRPGPDLKFGWGLKSKFATEKSKPNSSLDNYARQVDQAHECPLLNSTFSQVWSFSFIVEQITFYQLV